MALAGLSRGFTKIYARDGTPLVLRPIRTSDVEALQRGFDRLTPEEVRMRFLGDDDRIRFGQGL